MHPEHDARTLDSTPRRRTTAPCRRIHPAAATNADEEGWLGRRKVMRESEEEGASVASPPRCCRRWGSFVHRRRGSTAGEEETPSPQAAAAIKFRGERGSCGEGEMRWWWVVLLPLLPSPPEAAAMAASFLVATVVVVRWVWLLGESLWLLKPPLELLAASATGKPRFRHPEILSLLLLEVRAAAVTRQLLTDLLPG
ncbi:uncharacterized protein LOC110265325 [Arachis ipaensis]|uniref:uncharacterized protein LOC110265325 n=1 Tax=Arachis ipaensis TaxID=130454 RepID=UPI000A2B6F11|nr:uncharacterized protein LOC110265325 [Arachis ipaensis]